MPRLYRLLIAILAVLNASACRITYDATKETDEPVKKSVGEEVPAKFPFRLALPRGDVAEASLLPELIQEFNVRAGAEVLQLAGFTNEHDSPVSITSDITPHDQCSGEKVTTTPPVMKLAFDRQFLRRFVLKRRQLTATALFPAFCHCIGHGLGFDDSENPADIMGPDPEAGTAYDPFFVQVKAVLGITD